MQALKLQLVWLPRRVTFLRDLLADVGHLVDTLTEILFGELVFANLFVEVCAIELFLSEMVSLILRFRLALGPLHDCFVIR